MSVPIAQTVQTVQMPVTLDMGLNPKPDEQKAIVIAVAHPNVHRRKYEFEKDLKPIIDQMTAQEGKFFSQKVLHLTARLFLEKAKKHPWETTAKASAVFYSIALLFPTIIGHIACVNAFRWTLNDLNSSDLNKAITATQDLSNLGPGFAYPLQNAHIIACSCHSLFHDSYELAKNSTFMEAYREQIKKIHSQEERNFINECLKQRYDNNLKLLEAIEQEGKEESPKLKKIKNDIKIELTEKLSLKKVSCLTARKFSQETKQQPLRTIARSSFAGLAFSTLYPFLLGTLACFYALKVIEINTLFSSDNEEAVGTYANIGHVGENSTMIALVTVFAIQILFKTSFKTAKREVIDNVFDNKINEASLTDEESNALYNLKQNTLKSHGLL